jgi:hypothetical protein
VLELLKLRQNRDRKAGLEPMAGGSLVQPCIRP